MGWLAECIKHSENLALTWNRQECGARNILVGYGSVFQWYFGLHFESGSGSGSEEMLRPQAPACKMLWRLQLRLQTKCRVMFGKRHRKGILLNIFNSTIPTLQPHTFCIAIWTLLKHRTGPTYSLFTSYACGEWFLRWLHVGRLAPLPRGSLLRTLWQESPVSGAIWPGIRVAGSLEIFTIEHFQLHSALNIFDLPLGI